MIAQPNDQGFSMIELLTSIGIFAVLMALISTFAIRGMLTIREMSALSEVQTQEQNAAEYMSRLLRFTDNPVETLPATPAITYAGTVAGLPKITFFTYAGTGATDRIPYLATIQQTASGIESSVCPANVTVTPMVCTGTAHRRVLVPKDGQNTPTLRLKYWAGTAALPAELTPAANTSLTTALMNSLRAVQFTITGTGSNMTVDQTVVLENPRS